MIKIESLIFSKNDFMNKKNYSILLEDKKLHFIYSSNLETLENLFYIMTNYNKPYSGSIVFDDVEYLKLNMNQKNYFLKKNVGTVSSWEPQIEELTIHDFMFEIGINILNRSKSEIVLEIEKHLEQFQLDKIKHLKIKDLNSLDKLRLNVAQSLINNPCYIFINNIDGFLDNYDKKILAELIEQYFDKKQIIIFGSKNIFEKNANLVNLDNIKNNNEMLYFRNNQEFIKSIENKTCYKNLLYFVNKMVIKNFWIMFIWLISSFIFCSLIFLLFNNKKYIDNPFNDQLLFDNPFLNVFLKVIIILVNIFWSSLFVIVLFHKNKSLFRFWIIKGLKPSDLTKIIFTIIAILWTTNAVFLTITGVLVYVLLQHNISVSVSISLNVLFLASYCVTWIIIFFIKNKKYIKFNEVSL